MSVSVGIFVEGNHFNHDAGPQDLTDINGNPATMKNEADGFAVRAEVEGVIPGTMIAGRLELLSARVGVGYTHQRREYATDVYAPAECEEYVEGGVGNVGSAGNCGETGEAVDATTSPLSPMGF